MGSSKLFMVVSAQLLQPEPSILPSPTQSASVASLCIMEKHATTLNCNRTPSKKHAPEYSNDHGELRPSISTCNFCENHTHAVSTKTGRSRFYSRPRRVPLNITAHYVVSKMSRRLRDIIEQDVRI